MKNLREARDQGQLDEFAKAHEPENPDNEEAFNRALASMTGKWKEAHEASSPPDHDG